MLVPRGDTGHACLSTSADASGNLAFQGWPAWNERLPQASATIAASALRQPTVSFDLPSPETTAVRIAVPIQGVVDEIFTDDKAQPKARVVSELAFAGSAANGKYDPVGPQPAAFAVVVFHCEDGTVLGTVGAARNISERKAAEAAREMALAEAMRLARQRSEFLAQMSHELRTPLNAILGYAQILRHDSNLCERQMRGLATILESGQHLLTLINDILDLARIDADKLKLNPNTINLASFVHVVADIIGVKVDEKSLSFSWQLEPGLSAAVKVDDRRLRQVLLNLLGNAVKFTDRGAIALRVQCAGCRGKATA